MREYQTANVNSYSDLVFKNNSKNWEGEDENNLDMKDTTKLLSVSWKVDKTISSINKILANKARSFGIMVWSFEYTLFFCIKRSWLYIGSEAKNPKTYEHGTARDQTSSSISEALL